MRRADFLALTGLTMDAFYSLERRERLPFKRPARGAWSDFSSVAAFKMTLFSALEEQGASQVDAALFVRLAFNDALEQLTAEGRADPLYFGFVTVGSEDFNESTGKFERAISREPVIGTWREVGRSIKSRAKLARSQNEVVFGSTLIDSTLVMTRFRTRAAAAGLLDLVETDFATALNAVRDRDE